MELKFKDDFFQDPNESRIHTSQDVMQDFHKLEFSKDLDPLIDRIGNAKYVLLGEASHGTHEYYTWRTAISKRLIKEKGFSFIAVEGDWPDCYKINRFIKGYKDSGSTIGDVLRGFNRWPTWMWANWEIAALAEWMKEHNYSLSVEKKVGFYGLDVYSLWESMETILNYLQKEDPKTAEIAKQAFRCFEPYEEEGIEYARASFSMSANCQEEVVRLLQEVRKNAPSYNHDKEAGLNAEQNALVAVNAEKYYRAMVSLGSRSWNVRDIHMVETLNNLTRYHGPDAKVIVWEHNTHIGDARFTSMQDNGMVNVGQLTREQHEKDGVVLVGFGSYEGSVIAGSHWGAPMQKMNVPPAIPGSVEDTLHKDGKNKLLIFNKENLKKYFNETLGHRAIGVVYDSKNEKGNYVPTVLSSRYDAFLFIDKTKALHPIYLKTDPNKLPDTYPFAF